MSKVYYHATPAENQQPIIEEGLNSSPANECDCNRGVHLAETVDSAYEWIARLRNERDEYYYAEFKILQVTIPEGIPIVEDEFIGYGEGVIACTTQPIPSECIGVYERV